MKLLSNISLSRQRNSQDSKLQSFEIAISLTKKGMTCFSGQRIVLIDYLEKCETVTGLSNTT